MPVPTAQDRSGGRPGDARFAVSVATLAGCALALMEIASVLSQPGAAVASPIDLLLLGTWLAIPYAMVLGLAGLAVSIAGGLATGPEGRRTLFVAGAASCAIALWIRTLVRLGESSPSRGVLELMLLLVAAGAGASAGLLARRRRERRGAPGAALPLIAGLATLVVLSRNTPGPFGRATPPPAFVLRLGLAAVVWAAALLIVRVLRRRPATASPGAGPRWAGRAAAVALVLWAAFGLWDFTRLLSRRPAISATGGQASPSGPSAAAGEAPGVARPSVLVISIDTLRADHLSCYGYPARTSPQIDRLAAEGIRFAETASTASFTLPAHASMMTGLFPGSHGATYQNRDAASFTVRGMGTGYPTLAEILRDHGYDTAGFVSGPLMSRQFGFGRGFQTYDDRYDRLQTARARLFARTLLFRGLHRAGVFSDRDLDSQRIAAEINPLAEAWLRPRLGAGRPFFLFLHYWDPHGPYAPPPPDDRRDDGSPITVEYDMDRLLTGEYTLTGPALSDTLALYDGEIRYVDRHVGELLEMLRSGGALDRTLVILTSDHGESFGEHGHWEHSRVLYEDLLHVPFIMRLPGPSGPGRVVTDVIAQPTDILPTVLSAAGIAIPEPIEGRDLLGLIAAGGAAPARPDGVRGAGLAFAELDRNIDWPRRWGARYDRDLVAARTLRWKYIQSSTGQEELYDLEEDPSESRNLARDAADAAATLRALVETWRRTLSAGPEGRTDAIDEGLKDNLRSLGYVQ